MTPQTLTMRQAAQYLKDKHNVTIPHKNLREYLQRRLIPMTKEMNRLLVKPKHLDSFAATYTPQGQGKAWRQHVTNDEGRDWMTVGDVVKETGMAKSTVYAKASMHAWRKKYKGRLVLYSRADAMAPINPRKPKTLKMKPNFNVGVVHAKAGEKLRNRAAIADVVRRYQAGKVTAIVAERGEGMI